MRPAYWAGLLGLPFSLQALCNAACTTGRTASATLQCEGSLQCNLHNGPDYLRGPSAYRPLRLAGVSNAHAATMALGCCPPDRTYSLLFCLLIPAVHAGAGWMCWCQAHMLVLAAHATQVMHLLEKKREPPLQHVILDTPGQIEIFTWSASGQIVTELLASSFPTVVA